MNSGKGGLMIAGIFCVMLMMSTSFVSANWFTDFWSSAWEHTFGKIFGGGDVQMTPGTTCDSGADCGSGEICVNGNCRACVRGSADINFDGIVNNADLSLLHGFDGMTLCNIENIWCSCADINQDGIVNLGTSSSPEMCGDFEILMFQFNFRGECYSGLNTNYCEGYGNDGLSLLPCANPSQECENGNCVNSYLYCPNEVCNVDLWENCGTCPEDCSCEKLGLSNNVCLNNNCINRNQLDISAEIVSDGLIYCQGDEIDFKFDVSINPFIEWIVNPEGIFLHPAVLFRFSKDGLKISHHFSDVKNVFSQNSLSASLTKTILFSEPGAYELSYLGLAKKGDDVTNFNQCVLDYSSWDDEISNCLESEPCEGSLDCCSESKFTDVVRFCNVDSDPTLETPEEFWKYLAQEGGADFTSEFWSNGDFADPTVISFTVLPSGDPSCTSCTPDCDGKECGMDPVCGTINCGTCTAPETCENGICVPPACTDTCEILGYDCGTQTICGGSVDCGTCTGTETCNAQGQCVCTPNCVGKVCGASDGCTGICLTGICPSGETCVEGDCVLECQNDCTDGETRCVVGSNSYETCGDYNLDGCFEWGDINNCDLGMICNSDTNFCECNNECSEGQTQCDGNDLIICIQRGNGCFMWGAPNTCVSGCNNGACIQNEPSCADSDGGKEYLTAGNVYGTNSEGGLYSEPDVCVNSNLLTEYFCNGVSSSNEEYDCSLQNKVCDSGRCVVLESVSCELNGMRIKVKARVDDNSDDVADRYCDPVGLVLRETKIENADCNNDYECVSNSCKDGICRSTTKLIEEQVSFLTKVWCCVSNFGSCGSDDTTKGYYNCLNPPN